MKKTISFVLALLLAVAFTACGGSAKAPEPVEPAATVECVPAPGEICPA